MDFSESITDMFSRLVIKSDKLTNAEKDKLLGEGISDPIIDKLPVFFAFDKELELEAELLGNAPDYIEGNNQPIKCWNFKDKQGNIFHVPKYEQLNTAKDRFLGFDNEVPGERFYKIIFNGEKKLDGGGFVYQFTVFHKKK